MKQDLHRQPTIDGFIKFVVIPAKRRQPRRAGIQLRHLNRRNWIPDNLRFTAVSGVTIDWLQYCGFAGERITVRP